MSHHHMTLPPMNFLPPPKIKSAKKRTSVTGTTRFGVIKSADGTTEADDADELEHFEAGDIRVAPRHWQGGGQDDGSATTPSENHSFVPIGAETMTALLSLQEQSLSGDGEARALVAETVGVLHSAVKA